jgi:hypothetical protein
MNTLKKGTYFFGETFAPFFQTGGRVFYFIGKSISTGNSPCDAMQAVPRYADKRVVAVVAASAQRALAFFRAVVYAM